MNIYSVGFQHWLVKGTCTWTVFLFEFGQPGSNAILLQRPITKWSNTANSSLLFDRIDASNTSFDVLQKRSSEFLCATAAIAAAQTARGHVTLRCTDFFVGNRIHTELYDNFNRNDISGFTYNYSAAFVQITSDKILAALSERF